MKKKQTYDMEWSAVVVVLVCSSVSALAQQVVEAVAVECQ